MVRCLKETSLQAGWNSFTDPANEALFNDEAQGLRQLYFSGPHSVDFRGATTPYISRSDNRPSPSRPNLREHNPNC
jgi:hypothetical protein